jgi:hypothetical protein
MKKLTTLMAIVVVFIFTIASAYAGERTTISIKNDTATDANFYLDKISDPAWLENSTFNTRGFMAGGVVASNTTAGVDLTFNENVYVTIKGKDSSYALHIPRAESNIMYVWNGKILRRLSGPKLGTTSSMSY